MGLHRLLGLTAAVPEPDALAAFYGELGLYGDPTTGSPGPTAGRRSSWRKVGSAGWSGWSSAARDPRTSCHGPAAHRRGRRPRRRRRRAAGGRPVEPGRARGPGGRTGSDAGPAAPVVPNAPGATVRVDERAPAVFGGPRPPRRLGHLVIGTPAIGATRDLLVQGIGLKVSDELEGVIAFLRCSPDHHNVALVESPVPLLQHYSWECDDIDHVGHSASALLRPDPSRAHLGSWVATSPARTSTGTCATRPAPTSSSTRTSTRSSTTRRGSGRGAPRSTSSTSPTRGARTSRSSSSCRPTSTSSRPRGPTGERHRDRPDDVVVVGAGPVGCALALLLGATGAPRASWSNATPARTRCRAPYTSTTRRPGSSRPAASVADLPGLPSRPRPTSGATATACRCSASPRPSRAARAGRRPTCSTSPTSRPGSSTGWRRPGGPAPVGPRRPSTPARTPTAPGSTSSLRTAGARRRVGASYVVGCDGANSTVRDLLGVDVRGPGLLLRLAGGGRRPPRAPGLRPAQPPGVRPTPAHHRGVRRPGTAALGVHVPARRVPRGARRGGGGVGVPGALGRAPRQRHHGPPRRLPVPRPVGHPVAPGPDLPGWGRRPPDAPLRRSGHVRRPARRRQPGLEARLRARPPRGGGAPRHLRHRAHPPGRRGDRDWPPSSDG